ncbi:conserved protein of unknown function [Georgfuchsia toluolica]|uniref:DUF3301 domain-containing protein n=1 Tax=Georgfuchsia toluolica TaxID=424218 RepID=A0A916J668_9PROT|nr:DUF3301 domain-containing protein [Georgfuchsia toluolica]CAG4884645.1 conserved protein of unknown function [Georgfuchsia toluolica]
MLSAFDIISLIVLGGLAWLWFDSFKAREAGIKAARFACESENLQLLDDTVAIASLRPVRNDDGQIALRRVYKFEFSDTGNNRRNGSVVLLGCRVVVVNIGLRLVSSDTVLH